MKNLKFKSIAAYNFLPFGPEGIELTFEDYGNIILVRGQNVDLSEDTKESSNGSGKSSIPEIVVYGLYGKTIKSPKKFNKNDVVHNLLKKNCKVEVCFDKYKIARGRSPDFLRLWESEEGDWSEKNEITQGKSADTQAKIEELIGLSYESFIKTSVFTDDQSSYFLEADTAKKREIVENLLSLDVYRQRFDQSKNLLKESKNSLKQFLSEYEIMDKNKISAENQINLAKQKELSWKNSKKNEISTILISVKEKKAELESLNHEKEVLEYEKAKKRLEEVNSIMEDNEKSLKEVVKNKSDLKEVLELNKKDFDAKKEKSRNINFEISSKKSAIELNKKEILKLHKHETGQTCKMCYGKIDPNNYAKVLEKYEKENKELEQEIEKLSKEDSVLNILDIERKVKENEKAFSDFNKQEQTINNQLNSLRAELVKLSSTKEPQSNSKKKVLETEIDLLTKKAKDLKNEYENLSPYSEIISKLEEDATALEEKLKDKKDKIQESEKEIPYYEFWVDAFGDGGIRKWVVDGIVPALNSKLMYWMQMLDNNRLKIEFNNELEESIYKIIDDEQVPFHYYTMSAGQKRRLNLATSQSFAHVMMLTTGTCPSIVFLDEVTTNIDPIGVSNIYNMICELAEDRQVFVTTHDNDLLSMLTGADVLNLKMENGISKLEKK